ncbi:hypothetical protein, unknown function [Leishmania mexicana MHOM/GT/2001/U1103]|uniref:Uncharacterized protein n=1 Tax=Leishmania mexicana (strain MHOM/GT/2001/U1103) TaxID=929439 RepID=E9AP44_LEIMU|nr:hypothetical protein, unknown function [Leishmania mexicana MHOM/GT/2001/U1103]CBZ24708.1 hypothetical protein, unknown function [Leishmania mexicana MHOM/GT/2001/U1103]
MRSLLPSHCITTHPHARIEKCVVSYSSLALTSATPFGIRVIMVSAGLCAPVRFTAAQARAPLFSRYMNAMSAAFLLFTISPCLAMSSSSASRRFLPLPSIPTPPSLVHARTHTNWTAFSALEEVEHTHAHTDTDTPAYLYSPHTRTGLCSHPNHHQCLIHHSQLSCGSPPTSIPFPSTIACPPSLHLVRIIHHRQCPSLSLLTPGTAMATSTSVFTEFAREWGGLLAKDSSASMDHLFSAYARLKEANEVARSGSSSSEGSGESPLGSPVASIEDFTDVWAASKRANKEWEATCMVRSIRRSIGGSVTQTQLMLSMLCWAAMLRQQEQRFFKEFLAQVREIIHRAALRCTASDYDEGSESIYEEVAFCVALELLGWHDSLLICHQRAMASSPPLRTEDDVLLFTRKVAQELVSTLSPRRYSTDSTPAIITRSSAASSTLEHEPPAPTAVADTRSEAMAGNGVVVVSGRRSPSKEGVPSLLRRPGEHAHAVGRSDTVISIAVPFLSPRNTVDTRKPRQIACDTLSTGATPLPTPASSPMRESPAPTVASTHRSSAAVAADSPYKEFERALREMCSPLTRPSACQENPPHKRDGARSTAAPLSKLLRTKLKMGKEDKGGAVL